MDCTSSIQHNNDNTPVWPYRVYGLKDAYPVVLLHGFMQDASEWDYIAQQLARHFYVCTPTIHIEHSKDATLDALADKLVATVQDALELANNTPFALVGYSMGGRISLHLAQRHPHIVSALILESAGIGPRTDEERHMLAARNASLATRLKRDGIDAFVRFWEDLPLFASQQTLDSCTQQQVHARRLACHPHELALLLEHAGAHRMNSAPSALHILDNARFPALYIAGALDAKYSAIANTLPTNVQTRIIEAGHNVHLEAPDDYVQTIEAFLGEASTLFFDNLAF